jgi:hypothetical protein
MTVLNVFTEGLATQPGVLQKFSIKGSVTF